MKKLMIMGAGVYQVPLIRKAKEMGIYTIVVSIPGRYPGFALADKSYEIDTVNSDAVLEAAERERIDGIVTTGTDVAVVTIGKVCDALGLRGVSARGAEIACDKSRMKEAFLANGVQTAACHFVPVCSSCEELEIKCGRWGYPLIFKAVDSSGSRGITVVTEPKEIPNAVKAVQMVTKQENYIIETYLEGMEFGAQAYIQDGKLEFVLPHGDYVFKGETGVPVGHYAPFPIPDLDTQIYNQILLAAQAMKIDNCAINADLMLYNGNVYVLELGARCGATCLAELVSLYFGYNYYEKIIQCALGEKTDFSPCNPHRVPNASHLLMSGSDGVLEEIDDQNTHSENLVEVVFDYFPGERVRKFRVGPDRIGHVIVKGDTLEQAEKELKSAMEGIHIKVKEC